MTTDGDALDEVLRAAALRGTHKQKYVLGPAPAWLIEQLRAGVVSIGPEFVHAIDVSAVKHIPNRHGDIEIERSRGQISVVSDDFRLIGDIVGRPDLLLLGASNAREQPLIGYVRRGLDTAVLYAEEVRFGRRELAGATMRKFPPTSDTDRIAATLTPHVRNASGGRLKIVRIPWDVTGGPT